MDVEISKAREPETPASSVSDYVMEHVTALMTLGGIESIGAKKYTCGFGSRLHVTIAPFSHAPDEIKAEGVIIKDALAAIMSIANVTRVVLKPEESDIAAMRDAWERSIRAARAANGGSGEDVLVSMKGKEEA